ncbi:hypothetical protein DFH27DRAFT_643120 [Peziza echinospora]|nr:hypothetical protein DFH27DRAFT_643120 [Peziza echinospora]
MSQPAQADLASKYRNLLDNDLIINNYVPTKHYAQKLGYTRSLWITFCQKILNIDPIDGLFSTNAMWAFLKSRMTGDIGALIPTTSGKPYRPLKRSSIIAIFNQLRVLYRNATSKQLDTKQGMKIYASIESHYKKKDAEPAKTKFTFTALDAAHVISDHWTGSPTVANSRYMVQLPAIILISCYTTLRPGSIVESDCHASTNESFLYENFELCVIRNHRYESSKSTGFPNILLGRMINNLQKRKRHTKTTEYPLIQNVNEPMLCPILPLLILAFVDKAFKSAITPETLFTMLNDPNTIPPQRESYHLEWLDTMMDKPIFRRAKGRYEAIHPHYAQTYQSYNNQLKALGEAAGFKGVLTAYCIRRGAATAIDDVTKNTSKRSQFLGHERPGMFDRYYMGNSVTVDCQSAFMKSTPETVVMELFNSISISRDYRAPLKLPKNCKDEVYRCEEVGNTTLAVNKLLTDIRAQYGSTKKSPLHIQQELAKLRNHRSTILRRKRKHGLLQQRKKFFSNINSEELNLFIDRVSDPPPGNYGCMSGSSCPSGSSFQSGSSNDFDLLASNSGTPQDSSNIDPDLVDESASDRKPDQQSCLARTHGREIPKPKRLLPDEILTSFLKAGQRATLEDLYSYVRFMIWEIQTENYEKRRKHVRVKMEKREIEWKTMKDENKGPTLSKEEVEKRNKNSTKRKQYSKEIQDLNGWLKKIKGEKKEAMDWLEKFKQKQMIGEMET